MNRISYLTVLFGSLMLLACGEADVGTEKCTAANHCHLQDGIPACDDGYTWEDPDDNDNLRCVPANCEPEADNLFCSRMGKDCGVFVATDNCGDSRTVNCGTCTGDETCGGGGVSNVCGIGPCTPETNTQFCDRLGAECGNLTAGDNCGDSRTVNCGICTGDETCGGGGVSNVCGIGPCTPETNTQFCDRLGAECGNLTADDNCGDSRTVNCGSCGGGETCGGGGVDNVCGEPWSTLPDMPTARSGLAAVWGADGRLYAIGGYADAGRTDVVEAYDPSVGGWTNVAPMPTARSGLAAVLGQDDRIYAIAGSGAAGAGLLGTVEAYSPGADAWETVASLNWERSYTAAVVADDGRIYVMGGMGAEDSVEVYDPSGNQWSVESATLTTPRHEHVATLGLDGRIYVIGGSDGSAFGALAATEMLNPTSAGWFTRSDMPTARWGAAAATASNGCIYVIGGADNDGATEGESTRNECFEYESNTWTAAPSMPTARYLHAAALGPDGSIYVLGGLLDILEYERPKIATVEVFRPSF